MASTSLYLKNSKATDKTRIYCKLTDGRNKQMQIPTGVSVNPKHWSKKNSIVLSANNNALELNKQLKEFKNRVLNIYNDCLTKGLNPTPEYIKEGLKPKEIVDSQNKTFWSVWGYFIEANKQNYKEASFKKFATIKSHLKGFEDSVKIPLELDTINSRVFESLQDYFYNVAKLNTQTTAKNIHNIKTFLNWSVKNLYTENTAYKQFKVIQQPETLKVVLSKDDIEKIKKLDLTKRPYLHNTRQLLILSVYTGLRHSDYNQIKREHIKEDKEGKFLQILQQKTNEWVNIPLVEESEKIINELVSGNLHGITNQKMNQFLKDLCSLANIDEPTR